ncbi:MAG: GNAT family N-acetyltransferase [Parabacteroides sp.]|nr:GNAT family N-acetyltransferase [Parabacteroides sp.]
MEIRYANKKDIHYIINIHLKSFNNFFLTFLGKNFLILLYNAFLDEKTGILILAENQKKIVGFVGGVTNQSGFYRNLVKKNVISFAWASMSAFLKRPSIAPRLLRALFKVRESKKSLADACLMSIAVAPELSGKGVGKKLLTAFCKELNERKYFQFCLTTDADKNDIVNHFYQDFGLKVGRTFVTPEGRRMHEYLGILDEQGNILR